MFTLGAPVDFVDRLAKAGGLIACGVKALHHRIKVAALVKVMAFHLRRIRRQLYTLNQHGFRRSRRRGRRGHGLW